MSEENKNEILMRTPNAVPVEGSEANINEASVTTSEEKLLNLPFGNLQEERLFGLFFVV